MIGAVGSWAPIGVDSVIAAKAWRQKRLRVGSFMDAATVQRCG